MYNGIGLTTPRGSGTNGYVVRNLSHLRPRDPMSERAAAFDRGAPSFREPDQGILEHEKKRKVELRCLELQLEMEEKETPDDEINEQVDALRKRLYDNLASISLPTGKDLKPSDTHGIALAKKQELSKMARALGTSANYVEGAAFDREKQGEMKHQRAQERAARDAQREEAAAKREEARVRAEAEQKEKDRLRRRREYEERLKREREGGPDREGDRARDRGYGSRPVNLDRDPRDGPPPRRRSISPHSRRRDDRSISPPPRRRRDSRSPPPASYRGRRQDSRSPPRPPRRRVPSRSPSRSRSPPRKTRSGPGPASSRRSPSPRRRSPPPVRVRSESRSPRGRRRDDSGSPRGESKKGTTRAPSESSMSMSSGSRRSRSRSP